MCQKLNKKKSKLRITNQILFSHFKSIVRSFKFILSNPESLQEILDYRCEKFFIMELSACFASYLKWMVDNARKLNYMCNLHNVLK